MARKLAPDGLFTSGSSQSSFANATHGGGSVGGPGATDRPGAGSGMGSAHGSFHSFHYDVRSIPSAWVVTPGGVRLATWTILAVVHLGV